jgi:hypothetical protein
LFASKRRLRLWHWRQPKGKPTKQGWHLSERRNKKMENGGKILNLLELIYSKFGLVMLNYIILRCVRETQIGPKSAQFL